jgi:UDP-N-acetylmuramoylalanine--D-glutamate ligase
MPHIAVVTGCTPNHLDWHRDFTHYTSAKQRLLTGQTSQDVAVLNPWDHEAAAWTPLVQGRSGTVGPLDALPRLPVPGEHNRIDAACAAAAAIGAGCDLEAVHEGLRTYRPLPQRLEFAAVIDGRSFYNDSTATTPESTIAALRALNVPIWLMAGGKNKGFDFEPLTSEIVARAAGAAFFGACREQLREGAAKKSPQFACTSVETMADALQWCRRHAQSGNAVLLSPGCASTDQFRNFRERGQRFVELLTNERSML